MFTDYLLVISTSTHFVLRGTKVIEFHGTNLKAKKNYEILSTFLQTYGYR